MNKKVKLGLALAALAIGLVLVISGCDLFAAAFSGEAQPYGKVINAKTGGGVAAVTVELAPVTQAASSDATKQEETTKEQTKIAEEKAAEPTKFLAVTNTAGEFDWLTEDKAVPRGEYTLTASIAGNTFVFLEKKVFINAVFPDLGTLLAIPADNAGISFIMLWNTNFDDVDSYITFPRKNAETITGTAPTFTTPYDIPTAGVTTGFTPELFTTGNPARGSAREWVYYGIPSTASDSSSSFNSTTFINTLNLGTMDYDANEDGTNDTYLVSLDTDATLGSGPETISVRAFPFLEDSTDVSTTGGAATGLPAGSYTWVGVMEYYVDAYDSSWSDTTNDRSEDYLSEVGTGNSADAVLWVIQGTSILGKYTVPDYTQIKTSSLVRINCFFNSSDQEVYQLVPDIRVLQSTSGIRSIDDNNGIIVVTGNQRRTK